jgi:hypothetical protein
MVIITTLIAKIYFPESLDRGRPGRGVPSNSNYPRSYSYKRSKDAEAPPESNPSSNYSDSREWYGSDMEEEDDDEDEVLDSGENDDDDEEEEFDLLRNQQNPNHSKRYNILEFDQDRTSKAQVMRRLLFCSLMLNITFVSWGFLQVST